MRLDDGQICFYQDAVNPSLGAWPRHACLGHLPKTFSDIILKLPCEYLAASKLYGMFSIVDFQKCRQQGSCRQATRTYLQRLLKINKENIQGVSK